MSAVLRRPPPPARGALRVACPGAPEGRLPWSCPLFLEGREAGASAPGVPATGLDPQGPTVGRGRMGPEEVLVGSVGAGDPGPGKRKTDLTLGERQLLLPISFHLSALLLFILLWLSFDKLKNTVIIGIQL